MGARTRLLRSSDFGGKRTRAGACTEHAAMKELSDAPVDPTIS
jgi:hypothetical protein